MNEDIFQGNWKQFKGEVQNQWGKLTDDQFDRAEGNREKFLGELQESYGIGRDEAERQLKEFEAERRSAA